MALSVTNSSQTHQTLGNEKSYRGLCRDVCMCLAASQADQSRWWCCSQACLCGDLRVQHVFETSTVRFGMTRSQTALEKMICLKTLTLKGNSTHFKH